LLTARPKFVIFGLGSAQSNGFTGIILTNVSIVTPSVSARLRMHSESGQTRLDNAWLKQRLWNQ
jgi:hypothetical protein